MKYSYLTTGGVGHTAEMKHPYLTAGGIGRTAEMKRPYLITGGLVLIVGLSGLMWWLVTSSLQTSPLQTSSLQTSVLQTFRLQTSVLQTSVLQTFRLQTSVLQTSKSIKLDKADDAVDDMYKGCREKMEKKVIKTYFREELKKVKIFRDAWEKAEYCSNQSHPEDEDLTQDHMQAICAYTSDIHKIYKEFNVAVRTGKKNYTSSFKFQFHSLHFWLTTAIQILNEKEKEQCQTSYRRTEQEYDGKLGKNIRFGTFTSSSKLTNLTDFGNTTCFEIKTCLGAYLKNYSSIEAEQEVLIPPYEIFKITKIIKGEGKFRLMPECEKVFILESEGKSKSKLNCKAAK